MDTPPVPNDMWICGSCNTGNLIEIAPSVCPICSHPRDYGIGCCANPGETTWSTGLFSSQHEFEHPPCDEALDGSCVQQFEPNSGRDMTMAAPHMSTQSTNYASIYNEHVLEAGASVTQHPLHQHNKAVTLHHAMTLDISTFGGAGSQGDGVWICENCGEPNASFHWPQCGDCGHIH